MSEPVETKTGAVEAVADCPHCGKPMPLCICDSITPVKNRIQLLILQHPQEQDRALGTARLTARHFKDAVVKIGVYFVHERLWNHIHFGRAKPPEYEI